ncbi:hypothetical protein [Mycolicibacterium mageritense]|uniref:hypothetical protein n=1 Tax=Mycolicibacterium mageritense TaxID=53462 RepID=UPI0011DA37BC|nr:hypothetical protein [Mycolicibacterium mageritense]TXI65321.1 MAG: hypothetical protein E6Q55_02625 [Mycolicibacterium mageritense]
MDIKNARDLVRGDRINASAAVDAAVGESDERFYFDNLDSSSAGAVDTMVEGCASSGGCTTVYTSEGAFSVPDDFPVRIIGYASDY